MEEEDGETQLRDAVMDVLEAKGVLSQIRATLRAAVFTAIDEHERSSGQGVHGENPRALQVKTLEGGVRAIALIEDFLKKTGMRQSLSVFRAEMGSKELDDEDDWIDVGERGGNRNY